MNDAKVAICTISSHNYMAYGLTCLLSANKYNQKADLFYLVADKFDRNYYKEYEDTIEFVSLERIGKTNRELLNLAFKYNVVEFNTCIKPSFYRYLFEMGYDTVIYLDPDIECYNSFDDFLSRNDNYSIIVSPHKTSSVESTLIEDRAFLNNGIYNLGFIAMNRSETTENFLVWWDNKLKNECFHAHELGLATDQIWVELASTIFKGFKVDCDYGLNAAFWNIHERRIENGKPVTVNGYPLVFFHFSSLSVNCSKEFLNMIEQINPGFIEFYDQHIEKVMNNRVDFFSSIPYTYETFDNGETIGIAQRRLYGYSTKLQDTYNNPFSTGADSYYKKILKKRLIFKRKDYDKKKLIVKYATLLLGTNSFIEIANKLSSKSISIMSSMLDEE